MHVLHVVGARPNFMKVAPVWSAAEPKPSLHQTLVHTGQHYDINMSDIFFTDLGLPQPHHYLGVGSGSHAQQTAAVMVALEKVILQVEPDWVVVYGDVNSTVAAALVCAKLQVPIAHVEAGLRSFDRTMPEEVNRVLTDQIADLLFTPSPDGNENLIREGVPSDKIHFVGNVMIDTLTKLLPGSQESTILEDLCLAERTYAVLTLHRPSNVDQTTTFNRIIKTLIQLSQQLPIVFPVHPRTRQGLSELEKTAEAENLMLIDPLGYVDFLRLMSRARLVLTDSGGIQEETTYLGIPCLTLRPNTERPITVDRGTNTLVGNDPESIIRNFNSILSNGTRENLSIPLWDGCASERIVRILTSLS